MSSSVPWWAFSSAVPDLADQVKDLFAQYGRAFGHLATIRADGGPGVHPVSPVVADGRLLCFVLPSPACHAGPSAQASAGACLDLQRDGRYALHAQSVLPASSPGSSSEGARRESPDDEAYLAGRAFLIADDADRARAAPAGGADADWQLFELTVAVAVFTHRPDPDSPPDHHIWRAP